MMDLIKNESIEYLWFWCFDSGFYLQLPNFICGICRRVLNFDLKFDINPYHEMCKKPDNDKRHPTVAHLYLSKSPSSIHLHLMVLRYVAVQLSAQLYFAAC